MRINAHAHTHTYADMSVSTLPLFEFTKFRIVRIEALLRIQRLNVVAYTRTHTHTFMRTSSLHGDTICTFECGVEEMRGGEMR